jgi:DNA-directed RNA polymerase omega subunit
MTDKNKTTSSGSGDDADVEPSVVDSRFRLIVVAALRSKQLQRGATPRIVADPLKRRNTSIALEEVRQGLVPFSLVAVKAQAGPGPGGVKPNGTDEHN